MNNGGVSGGGAESPVEQAEAAIAAERMERARRLFSGRVDFLLSAPKLEHLQQPLGRSSPASNLARNLFGIKALRFLHQFLQ